MTNVLMRILDPIFGHPRGVAGRLGGVLMARSNAEQECWVVEQAKLRDGEQVLVVGHGPGLGLARAAEAVTPGGHVIGLDPSATMRDMATKRCASLIRAGSVEIREGSAEEIGCTDSSQDVAISVNNVMLWDRPAGFAELIRVLRPAGRLLVSVHRHVLDVDPDRLVDDARSAGFADVQLSLRTRRFNSPAVELRARRPQM
ncbi:methylase involved in ubiquinone/menaquinone biosynthesis [Mycobacteroides abscessus subsp. massiliense]|uniref:class I SAM-dependent methyltransferase n=1 Tax=Mycobacteroides abscessus TaxID=36809 RepID=UPI0009A5B162|nr:methyltransferase domain-containing protein [Mycobacteroides abscessus]SKK92278.1 methylase involved in ubiquinone/menaquinone biosynthesis [Mycobacteroides abscessus subsp. massiliense]